MGDASPEKKSGCGLLNAVFGRRSFWPRRSTSTGSLATVNDSNFTKAPSTPMRRRSGSDESSFIESSLPQTPTMKAPVHPKIPPIQHHQNYRKLPEQPYVNQNFGFGNVMKNIPREAIGISGELETMIADHQKMKGSGNLVRASSSNVMLFGNLGNLRQSGGGNANHYSVNDYLPKNPREENGVPNGRYPNTVMGNVVKKQNEEKHIGELQGSLCRALSTRMDPEQLKILGNEDYKNGNFAEALALYDAAISIDPKKASYRSNKSAALTALGRILEAVFECREAIQIEPHYHRAHLRLGNLYLKLGEAEKAIYHYHRAGPEADHVDISKANALQLRLNKCTDARKRGDWKILLDETEAAISAGADSAPQIYALQAVALLKHHRHEDAYRTFTRGPHFEVEACTKFFGPIGNASLLIVHAQVNMAVGRFNDALAAAQRAAQLDPISKEVHMIQRKIQAVAIARSRGNDLFRMEKFEEARDVYTEGLDCDCYNSVLLCNRAACHFKLCQFEKAIEDCDSALNLRSDYSKARLRRASCYAKLNKWEASLRDYEILHKECPQDEEVIQGLMEAKKFVMNHED